jgi:hypothetical protein
MKLKDFAYHARAKMDRHGLQDFDIFLYPAPGPDLAFFQHGGRALAFSLPFVLLCDWTTVLDCTGHEVAHALTSDEAEQHGPRWKREARILGSWSAGPYTKTSAEFQEYWNLYYSESNARQRFTDELLTRRLSIVIGKEARARSGTTYRGQLRMDFI